MLRRWGAIDFVRVLLLPMLLGGGDTRGQTGGPAAGAARPLETALIGPLEGARVKVGDAVLARVVLGWSEPGCTLHAGAIVQGRVVSVVRRSKSVQNGAVQVAFHAADCDGHPETPREFRLVALVGGLGKDLVRGNEDTVEAPPLANVTGLAIGSGSGINGMRSVAAASDNNFAPTGTASSSRRDAVRMPSRILAGEVVAIPRTSLTVGMGAGEATEIAGTGRDVRLERGTMLVLVAGAVPPAEEADDATPVAGAGLAGGSGARAAGSPAAGGTMASVRGGAAVAGGAGAAAAVAEPPDETEICSGVCTIVARAGAGAELEPSAAAARMPLAGFGYSPRDRRELAAFDDETTLTYLDAHHLLCTFDPHRLRERAAPDGEAVRTVRAVLVDPTTHTTRRVLDWRVRGDEQYLWPVAGGRVLVHMGRELRLFDTELRPQRAIPVRGEVAWVAVSPSGEHMAIGTVRELHTVAEHRELAHVLAAPPEEEIEVGVFGEGFREVLRTTRSSRSAVPVLSDDGELRIESVGRGRWTISEYRWDRTEHAVATAKSACRPTLTTPEHGLIFAIGCTTSGGRWYRMLRTDGHPLLKGESPSDEIEQMARSSAGGTFAVRVIKTAKPMNYGQPFRRSDLLKEELGIYRSLDGATVSAMATADFAPSEEAFALSPGGDQIALVGRDAILFYPVKR